MRRLVILFIIFFSLPAYAEFWNLAREATTLSRPEGIFGGTPWPFFNSVAAENYDTGGQGVAFSMWQNPGCGAASQYRADSVNFFAPSDAGLAFRVGCVKLGDYLKYTVNIPSAGPYTISIRAAANADGGSWAVSIDNSPIATLPIPNTGSTSTFTTATTPSFNTSIGNHIVKLQVATVNASGFGPDLASFQGAQVGANPAPPPGAVAAGFTTLAANYDFSQPLYATQSNWLGCYSPTTGYPSTGFKWYQAGFSNSQEPPCNVNQVTDPVTGDKVMDLKWLAAYYNAYPGSGNDILLQTESHDGSGVTDFPNGYFEIVVRISNPNPTNPNNSPAQAFWEWGSLRSGGHPNPIEWDFFEFYPAPTRIGSASAIINHSNGAFQWIWQDLPLDWTQYHTIGFRITSDGSTQMVGCGYVDGSLRGVGCSNGQATAAQFNIRQYLIFNSGFLTTDEDMYVKSIRVWSCANWQTTMCNGTVLTGAP